LPNPLDLFAVTALGLESIAAAELAALGVPRHAIRPEPGGVAWRGDARSLYAANLRLRTASRVLVRVASFRATAFWELERRARPLAWERWLAAGSAVQVRATCRKSRLYHSDAVAERVLEAVVRRVSGVTGVAMAGDEGEGSEAPAGEEEAAADDATQLVVARVAHDLVTLSVDASGELLHRRGYRQAVARAPLRETIAAAMLLAVGWDGSTPLVDPFCGSGTIPIEGALLARRIAPGLVRADRSSGFAFQSWPELDARAWREEVDAARAEVRPGAEVPIVGSDRDAGAVAAARENATRAGVAADATFERRALSDAAPPDGAGVGMLVTNPPYGVRVGDQAAVRDLWARFGQVVHERFGGWTAALLSPDPALDRQTCLRLAERFRTRNGGIPVRLVAGSP